MINLNNDRPIDPLHPDNVPWLQNLQGNILNGHGRDHTVNLFLRLPTGQADEAKTVIRELSAIVTSAHRQEIERREYKDFGIPGRLFCNLLLSANGYRKLGFTDAELAARFEEPPDEPRKTRSNFLDSMATHAEADLGDPPPDQWDTGFRAGDIDAMLLLADDDEGNLGRQARQILDRLNGRCDVVWIERGTALRNDDNEGIEHFGYIDGRSQPLYLTTDFNDLQNNGSIGPNTTDKDGGKVDVWDPFEPLARVLLPDPFADDKDQCLGSYFVFRKLEQNVRDFIIEEQRLADALGLKDVDRSRAGAMTVGRFRNGTPLVLQETKERIPPKDNNFRFGNVDLDGLRCPLHAHIRKTNPRGDIVDRFSLAEKDERRRRITRRGIPYGKRDREPNAFQALDELPSSGVGLLFMCFQASIRAQFAFMQRGWANNQGFVAPGATSVAQPGAIGLDPIIGQNDGDDADTPIPRIDQTWHPTYGSAAPQVQAFFGDFVTMKGGEFFFAPSIPFLNGLA